MSEVDKGPRFSFKDLDPKVLRRSYLQGKPSVIKSGGDTWNIESQDYGTPII